MEHGQSHRSAFHVSNSIIIGDSTWSIDLQKVFNTIYGFGVVGLVKGQEKPIVLESVVKTGPNQLGTPSEINV